MTNIACKTALGLLLTALLCVSACSSSSHKPKYVDIKVTFKIKGAIAASEGGCRQDDTELSKMLNNDPTAGGEDNILRAGRAVGVEYGDGGPSDYSGNVADYPDEDDRAVKNVSGGRLATGKVRGIYCVFSYTVRHVPLWSDCYAPTVNGFDGTAYSCYTSSEMENSPEMEFSDD